MLMTIPSSGQVLATSPRILWAAVGALGISTLALGATVLHLRAPSADLGAVQATTVATAPTVAVEAPRATPKVQVSVPKVPAAPVKYAQPATKSVANKRPAAPAAAGQTQADTVLASHARPGAPVCAVCGTVEGVTPVQREEKPSGVVGAVAGAAIGGLVGNQVGGGDGKTLATILGVLGGGWAGHTVEKRMKQETRYQVDVRMEDGSLRRIEQATPATVGAKVAVDGDTLGPASRPKIQQTAGAQTAI